MSHTIRTVLAPILTAMVLLLLVSGRISAQEPQLNGDIPDSGIALVLWSGGTVDELLLAAESEGCSIRSLWVSDDGGLTGYLVGSPDFVNSRFLSLYPAASLPESTAMVLVCVESTSLDAWAVLVCDEALTSYSNWVPMLVFGEYRGETVEALSTDLVSRATVLAQGVEAMQAADPPAAVADQHWAMTDAMAAFAVEAPTHVERLLSAATVDEFYDFHSEGSFEDPLYVAADGWIGVFRDWYEPPLDAAALAFATCRDQSPIPATSLEGSIAFSSTRDDGGVYVTNADGSSLRQVASLNPLPFGSPRDRFPSWSPDGSEIVFSSGEETEHNSGAPADLYIVSIDGGEPRRLTYLSDPPPPDQGHAIRGYAINPAWSPDGSRIVFECSMPSWPEAGYTICVLDPNGGELVRVGAGFEPEWAPDGSEIVFAFATERGIAVMNADGSNVRRLVGSTGAAYYNELGWSDPAWSPDGGSIAFLAHHASVTTNNRIQIMNADGTNVRPLRPGDPLRTSGDGIPSWSPDGKQIIFSTERVDPLGEPDYDGDLPASTSSIYIVNVDGTGLTRLTDAEGEDFMPVWIGD